MRAGDGMHDKQEFAGVCGAFVGILALAGACMARAADDNGAFARCEKLSALKHR
jgi:hypothetical protein